MSTFWAYYVIQRKRMDVYIIKTFQQYAIRGVWMGLISSYRDKPALQTRDRTHVLSSHCSFFRPGSNNPTTGELKHRLKLLQNWAGWFYLQDTSWLLRKKNKSLLKTACFWVEKQGHWQISSLCWVTEVHIQISLNTFRKLSLKGNAADDHQSNENLEQTQSWLITDLVVSRRPCNPWMMLGYWEDAYQPWWRCSM